MSLDLTPSQDQWMGQLRLLLPALGTLAIGLGANAASTNNLVNSALTIAGPAMIVVGSLWSLYANSRASIMKAAAKPVEPGVPPPQIVLPAAEKALADALPPNVTSAVDPPKRSP